MPYETFLRRFRAQAKVPKVMYKQLKNVAKKTILQVLAKYGPEDEKEDLYRRCQTFFDVKANRTLNTYFVAPPSPECHTLCHGDFWSNNILFSYKEDEGEEKIPDDLIIIDYQVWSITLNSILLTFQNQGSVYKSAFSKNAQSRFASVVVDSVLGPPRLARHT